MRENFWGFRKWLERLRDTDRNTCVQNGKAVFSTLMHVFT